jgi:beta-lactamase superfamily II metal-dependent hydrolase
MSRIFSVLFVLHRPLQSRFTYVAAVALLAVAFFALAESSQALPPGKPLEIYFVDVEGGQATLFFTPESQSLLFDTGWQGNAGRDADRIVAAAKKAGLSKIDFVLLTHYHQDHAGGVPQLYARIPVGAFIDHGANRETGDQITEQTWEDYERLVSNQSVKRIIAKVGDVLPFQGLRAEVVSSDGVLL